MSTPQTQATTPPPTTAPATPAPEPEAKAQMSPEFTRLLQQDVRPENFSVFGNVKNFTEAQRMAKALYTSSMVPESYRGEQHLGDCLIALEISNRIGANVLAVMQNLYIVHGRPGWSAQFLISCLNASRRFSPLRYELKDGEEREIPYSYTQYVGGQKQRKEGKVKIRDKQCIAWALDKSGQRLESPPITIGMAVQEGWYTKDGSKWKTMPDLMLCYRAATFFTRLYAPELTMGIQTVEEIQDFTPSPSETPTTTRPIFTPAPEDKAASELFPVSPACDNDGDLGPQEGAKQ